MNNAIRTRLFHAFLSALLTAGLLLPLLHILEPALLSPSLLIWSSAVILLFGFACYNRITAIVSSVLAAVSLAVWLFLFGGLVSVSDVFLAVFLRLSGVRSALPLIAAEAGTVLTVLVTLICCFSCLRGASVLPSSILCFGMILLIFLSGSGDVVPWFLPALSALLLIILTNRFPETPVLPLIPLTAFSVACAFLLAGGGVGPNPLRDRADELRQAVLDRLFFTEPRDVFSLSTEGYYPEGQDQLGGKPDPSDRIVMQVSAPRPVYLRGVILDQYTGRNWINTTGGRRYLRQSSRLASLRASLFDENLPPLNLRNTLCDPVTVSVRMLSDGASTLFVPQRVREITPGGDLVPYFSNSSELFVTRNLKSGDTYSVSAPLFTAGDSGLGTLIEVCSTLEDSRFDQVIEAYTSLPGHLEEPVYALAREAASVASSPYDRALALQSWLVRNYRYTLDVDYHPENTDFVTGFLLDTREGYCTYFASAMTVLCRMIGLPARYVEGWLAEPDETGEAVVTGLNAHAWTEVYFKGFGWLTFDATPKRGGNDSQGSSGQEPPPGPSPSPSPAPPDSGETDDAPTPEPDPDGKIPTPAPADEETPADNPPPESTEPSESLPSPDPETVPPDDPVQAGSFLWMWLLLLLLAAAAVLRVRMTSPSFRARHAGSESARFDIWVQELTDLLHAENLSRHTGESPMAFGRRVDRTGLFSTALGPVGECISLIRYSRTEVTETDTGLVRDTAFFVKRELSRPGRLRYLLRRCFIPVKRRGWV